MQLFGNKSLYICQEVERAHSPGIFYGQSPINFTFTRLMLQLILIISITGAIRWILKPFKQPRVVSDILGGIMLGPTMLGRYKSFSMHMFPQNSFYIIKIIGVIGFSYYLFLTGAKMDLSLARRATKKQLSFAAFGFLIPFAIGLLIVLSVHKFMDKELARPQIIGVVICVLAISSFPVIEQILKEFNLLSSEVGRLALATTIITDLVSFNCIIVFEAARHYDYKPIHSLWVMLSAIFLISFAVFCKYYVFTWIVNTTPEGKAVHESYVVAIFLGALVLAFYTDFTGVSVAIGPHWLGLMIPPGPPLGATVVERLETILVEFLMPFGFAFLGMATDLSSISANWGVVWPLFTVTMVVCVAKFWTVFVVSRFHEMTVKDSLAFSFVMGMKGQFEFVLFIHWLSIKVIPIPSFSMLVLVSTVITMVSAPMITILYDPSRPYMVNKRRAIQYTAPDTELKIVTCIYDQESVAGFISLLEVSNPTNYSPLTIYSLRLIELVGRAHPVFVDHENPSEAFELTRYNQVQNALTAFQESIGEYVKCHHFTSVSPTRTMYQDVCELALNKKATIIILPFRTELMGSRTQVVHHGVLNLVNTNVLSHAPCSVGILVDRTGPFHKNRVNYTTRTSRRHFAILFLGGADAREALAYAGRMAANPNVSLSVIRFLSSNGLGDDPMEKKLDDGLVTWFWVKNEGNERVFYKEVVVSDGSETVVAIQAMMRDCFYDMWIVGRKNGINPVLLQGLSNWSQNDELGVIGDYITNVDLAMDASVLVMHQQVLKGQEHNSSGLLQNIKCCY